VWAAGVVANSRMFDVPALEDNVEDDDDSDWLVSTDNDSVMSDDGESDE
jgi:hypothetical protein